MIDEYLKSETERKALGIPGRPLTAEQATGLVALLSKPPKGLEKLALELFEQRISPGVDPAAKVKADYLAAIAKGKEKSPLIDQLRAVELLGTMGGGYNVPPLIQSLKKRSLASAALKALSGLIYIYDAIDEVAELAKAGNEPAKELLESWARADWFVSRGGVPAEIKVKIFKVDGEINTDDLSPAVMATLR